MRNRVLNNYCSFSIGEVRIIRNRTNFRDSKSLDLFM